MKFIVKRLKKKRNRRAMWRKEKFSKKLKARKNVSFWPSDHPFNSLADFLLFFNILPLWNYT